jgi:hypothetical protein
VRGDLRVKSPRKCVNTVESVQSELPALHRFTSYKRCKRKDTEKTLCKKEYSFENFTSFFSDGIQVYIYIYTYTHTHTHTIPPVSVSESLVSVIYKTFLGIEMCKALK